MPNGSDRAEFWREFILTRCEYPNVELLRAEFVDATFFDFCECGCNSFKISRHSNSTTPAISKPSQRSGAGMVFEADFKLSVESQTDEILPSTLEVPPFAGATGHLAFAEVDCCGNSYPVPDNIRIDMPPHHVYASESLIR